MCRRRQHSGASLVEAMLAIGALAVLSSALLGSLVYGPQASLAAGDRYRATLLVQEGLEASKHLHDNALNEMTLTQSGVDDSSGEWELLGEGTTETIGKFSRTITYADVCRDASDAFVDCGSLGSTDYIDPNMRTVFVVVEWTGQFGGTKTVEGEMQFSNWSSPHWVQTDWEGGDGQTEWLDETQYTTDDGNLDTTTQGEVVLDSAEACSSQVYDFEVDTDYTYTSSEIEVTGGVAQLVGTNTGVTGIVDPVTDTFEFDTTYGVETSMIHIDGDIYAIAYRGPGNDGWLKTVEIASDGTVSSAAVDALEFDPTSAYAPEILSVSGSVYVIAYRDSSGGGTVLSVDIDSDGTIASAPLSSLSFDSSVVEPSMVLLDADTIAIAYEGPASDGWLATVDIDGSGMLSAVDTYEYNVTNGRSNDIFSVGGNYYAIAHMSNGADGWLATVEIASDGTITNTVLDSLEFDPSQGADMQVVPVDGTIYAIAYRGTSGTGKIATVDIDTSGNIAAAVTDVLDFNGSIGRFPSIVSVSGDAYAIAHSGLGNDGFLSVLDIDTSGNIAAAVTDVFEYDTSNGHQPSLIRLTNSEVAVAYQGPSTDGWLATIELTTNASYPTTQPTIEPNDVFAPPSVDVWSSFTETATKDGSAEVYYQLSDDGGATWYYYDGVSWVPAGISDYNTATEVNDAIDEFDTTEGQIVFQAFLVSDGTEQIQLDEVTIGCALQQEYDFDADAEYAFDAADIEVTGGVAQLVAGGSASADIADTVLDTLEFDTADGVTPSVVNVSGDVYAVAYSGVNNDGFVSTFEVDSSGNVSAVLDTLEFDARQGQTPEIIAIGGEVFAIAYTGQSNDGFIVTVNIDSAGTITSSLLGSFEFDTSQGVAPSILPVTGNIYAIAYTGQGNDGFLKTVEISSLGAIVPLALDTLEFDTTNGLAPHIAQVDGATFAVSYTGPGDDGWLQTVDIDSLGQITGIDSFEFEATHADTPFLTQVSGTVFALAYADVDGDGQIATIDISAAGSITTTFIDAFEYDTVNGATPQLVSLGSDIFLATYSGSGTDGFAVMIEIDSAGTITSTLVDSLEFDTGTGLTPHVVLVNSTVALIVYEGPDQDGWLATIGLSTGGGVYPTNEPTVQPAASLAPASVDAWVGFAHEVTTASGSNVRYQLSDDDGATWYYWDGGSWTAAGATDYNTVGEVNNNISDFSTASGTLLFRAFLISDGVDQVEIDTVQVRYQETGGTGVATFGELESSAYNMGETADVTVIDWDESIPTCTPVEDCDIQFQVRTAPDNGGTPDTGNWTDWYGDPSSSDYYDTNTGHMISKDLNGNQWVQYRVELTGDGTETPVLEEVRISYQ